MLDRAELEIRYHDWLARIAANHGGVNHRVNEQAWFTPLPRPLGKCTVALVTTAGAHLASQPPFHTATLAGDATYRLIPDDVDLAELRFSHIHYDTASAEKDPNVILPLDALHGLVAGGRLGAASPVHIGMMGFNPDPTPIAESTAPAVAAELTAVGTDVAILVPG